MKLFWAVVRFVLGFAVMIGGPVLSWEYGIVSNTHISPVFGLVFLAVLVITTACWFWAPSVFDWSSDCDKKPTRKLII